MSLGSKGIKATGSKPRNCFPPPDATTLFPAYHIDLEIDRRLIKIGLNVCNTLIEN